MLMRELKSFDPVTLKAKKVSLEALVMETIIRRNKTIADIELVTNAALRVLNVMFPNNDVYSHLFTPKRVAFIDMVAFELESYAQGGWTMLDLEALQQALITFAKETDLKLNDLAFAA